MSLLKETKPNNNEPHFLMGMFDAVFWVSVMFFPETEFTFFPKAFYHGRSKFHHFLNEAKNSTKNIFPTPKIVYL